MPTESSPLYDGAKIDLTEEPNATMQKPFPEQTRPKPELTHQFFDPHDAGCIKAAPNGNMLSDCGSSPQKDFVAATKRTVFQEFGEEAASKKGDAVLLGDLGATKERAKIGSVHKPLSLGDSDEENVEDDGEEEDVSSEEESVEEEEEEEYDDEDEEDEGQGVSEEDKDGHDDELGEPPAKRKK